MRVAQPPQARTDKNVAAARIDRMVNSNQQLDLFIDATWKIHETFGNNQNALASVPQRPCVAAIGNFAELQLLSSAGMN
jgi:hypothetical protein